MWYLLNIWQTQDELFHHSPIIEFLKLLLIFAIINNRVINILLYKFLSTLLPQGKFLELDLLLKAINILKL